jgi:hypothetical protein
VATELVGQFSKNLQTQLQAAGSGAPLPQRESRPISGFSLIWTVLKNAVLRILGRPSKN